MATSVVRVDDDLIPVVRGMQAGATFNEGVRFLVDRHRIMEKDLHDKEEMIMSLLPQKSGAAPRGPEKPVSFAVPAMEDGMPEQFWKRIRSEFKKEAEHIVERGLKGF